MDPEIIYTPAALTSFLDSLPQDYTKPNLFIDLEGNNLSRHGTLSLITILVEPRHTIHIIDVHVLGKEAFSTESTNGTTTLKKILQSVSIAKVFFDIRYDSDVLYSLYRISVGGIEDLQLMELATRTGDDKRSVRSLRQCIERDAGISAAEKQQWKAAREAGKDLIDPARGGRTSVFDRRPLLLKIERYAVAAVVHLPALYEKYKGLLTEEWRKEVQRETFGRIALSQGVGFRASTYGKGPKAWNPDGPKRKSGRRRTYHSSYANVGRGAMVLSNDDLVEQQRDARLDEFLWE
jgi:exonuclease 3'-5' domain-containing protein 1